MLQINLCLLLQEQHVSCSIVLYMIVQCILFVGGPEQICTAIRDNWCDIINPIRDATAFANELLQAKLISRPAFETAISRQTGQSDRDRVTNLLSSVQEAIKHREQRFVKLCEIVREVGDGAVADKLLSDANMTNSIPSSQISSHPQAKGNKLDQKDKIIYLLASVSSVLIAVLVMVVLKYMYG